MFHKPETDHIDDLESFESASKRVKIEEIKEEAIEEIDHLPPIIKSKQAEKIELIESFIESLDLPGENIFKNFINFFRLLSNEKYACKSQISSSFA